MPPARKWKSGQRHTDVSCYYYLLTVSNAIQSCLADGLSSECIQAALARSHREGGASLGIAPIAPSRWLSTSGLRHLHIQRLSGMTTAGSQGSDRGQETGFAAHRSSHVSSVPKPACNVRKKKVFRQKLSPCLSPLRVAIRLSWNAGNSIFSSSGSVSFSQVDNARPQAAREKKDLCRSINSHYCSLAARRKEIQRHVNWVPGFLVAGMGSAAHSGNGVYWSRY